MKSETKIYRKIFIFLFALLFAQPFCTAQFYGDPPDNTHPWAIHDHNRPQPPRVEPAKNPGGAPSDAIVLFDGSLESFTKNWSHTNAKRKKDWKVENGSLISVGGAGTIASKTEFSDCQLHIEWSAPSKIVGSGQGRGNSGVFLMGKTEVQVLDNFNNPTYPDGFAGSIYGVMPPMANSLNAPGQWQSYDIIFRRPILKGGKVMDEGSMTVLINGVVVQDSTPLEGGGGHRARSKSKAFPEKGPLSLQDHGNPVRFRNIWYRDLRKRPVDGGTDGKISPEVASKKRAEIAAKIRKDALTKEGKDKLLRLMESLYYQENTEAHAEAEKLGAQFVNEVSEKPEGRKGDVMQLNNAVKFLVKHKLMPSDHPGVDALKGLIEDNGWNK
jgi:hypothetical protein